MCGMCHVYISMYGPYFETENTVYIKPNVQGMQFLQIGSLVYTLQFLLVEHFHRLTCKQEICKLDFKV